jgi:ABC-type multidrug transport system ATPase subunit
VAHSADGRIIELGAGEELAAGRGPAADVRLDDNWVSGSHLRVYWDGRSWVAQDTGSTNGTFLDGRRVGEVKISGPVVLRLGHPDGPSWISLAPGGAAGPNGPDPWDPSAGYAAPTLPGPMPSSRPVSPASPSGRTASPTPSSGYGPPAAYSPAGQDQVRYLGRDPANAYVVNDVLASRHHAALTVLPDGRMALADLGSLNGTQVNGQPIANVYLNEGDIVTVGNTDLIVAGGTLREHASLAAGPGDLIVSGVDFTVGNGVRLLRGIDLQAGPGTLTALIGPSGAGKSTLGRLLAGLTTPSAGSVVFAGHDLHGDYASLRSRIGFVPQDDVVHGKLTVRQALEYAAELRLPADTPKTERLARVDQVMAELDLRERAKLRIDKLSGGQRKRVSVAIELITSPSLLVLDEPTSGLDPALDRQVMELLVDLAKGGRIVIVVTHSLSYLHLVDQVILLGRGGKPAYRGGPDGVARAFGTEDWAAVFGGVAEFPDEYWAQYLRREGLAEDAVALAMAAGAAAKAPRPRPTLPSPPAAARRREARRQTGTLVRRQFRLMAADIGYSAFLAALPAVLGGLALVVPGSQGFSEPPPLEVGELPSSEPQQMLVMMVLGACFMGASLSVRDLVGERPVFYRERAAGLAPSAYLFSKLAAFMVASVAQAGLLTAIVLIGKPGPGPGAVLPSGSAELLIDIALVSACSATVGMALSAFVKSTEQSMPLLVVVIMTQLVMCGGMIPVTGRAGLTELSNFFPSRWGFAAGASTVDLRELFSRAEPDALWNHDPGQWWLAVGALVVIGLLLTVLTYSKLRLRKAR